MAELTRNQLDFVERMKKSPEHARQGFELLLKRSDFDEFFDALQAAGLFDAHQNLEPTEADDSGSIRVPFWAALPYLVTCAQRSGERNDLALAAKVLQVVVAVSTFRLPSGAIVDNYHTFRSFAEILGHVPSEAVSPGGHPKLPHSWPGQTPPPSGGGTDRS